MSVVIYLIEDGSADNQDRYQEIYPKKETTKVNFDQVMKKSPGSDVLVGLYFDLSPYIEFKNPKKAKAERYKIDSHAGWETRLADKLSVEHEEVVAIISKRGVRAES